MAIIKVTEISYSHVVHLPVAKPEIWLSSVEELNLR